MADKYLTRDLVDVMARLLHWQDRGTPNFMEMTYEQAIAARELSSEVIHRYHTEPLFHAKVQRAVAEILLVIDPPKDTEDYAPVTTLTDYPRNEREQP